MTAITDLSDPLSDEEIERLQTILLDRVDEDAETVGKDEGVLDVSALDGLLTAVVSGPVTIVPSRWLPAVWGDFEPTWHSVDDYGAFMSMLMRHMNSIALTLIEEPEAFEPMYVEHVLQGKAVLVVDEWCEGFMRGVGLAADEWRAAAPEIADLLAPIRAFTAATDWQAHELSEPQAAKLRGAIAPNVPGAPRLLARTTREGRAEPRAASTSVVAHGAQRAVPVRQRQEIQEMLSAVTESRRRRTCASARVYRERLHALDQFAERLLVHGIAP